MTASPANTRAVIVGVERYEHQLLNDLDGPALDACRFAKWLVSRGVPEENIELFIAPLAQNVETCSELAGNIKIKAPTEDAVHAFLLRELPRQSNELLMFYWGGHGLMNNDQDRVLFTADANATHRANIQLTSLLSALRTDQYQGNALQQVFVDACSNFEAINEHFSALPQRISSQGQQQPFIDQFALFAADRGERAYNDRNEGTGYFSRILFQVLSKQGDNWPINMKNVFRETHTQMQEFMDSKLGQQTVVRVDYSAPREGTVRKYVAPKETRQMVHRISETETVTDSGA